MKKFTFLFAALIASVAMFAVTAPETNEALWEEFKPYYNTYYSMERADQPITAVAVFLSAGMGDDATIFTSDDSNYKWLGNYIKEVSESQSWELNSLVRWKFAVQAFFNCSPAKEGYSGNADFSNAGAPSEWKALYEANMPEPETPSAVENTTVTVKAQKVMIDGQVYMVREGKTFNMLGQEVK